MQASLLYLFLGKHLQHWNIPGLLVSCTNSVFICPLACWAWRSPCKTSSPTSTKKALNYSFPSAAILLMIIIRFRQPWIHPAATNSSDHSDPSLPSLFFWREVSCIYHLDSIKLICMYWAQEVHTMFQPQPRELELWVQILLLSILLARHRKTFLLPQTSVITLETVIDSLICGKIALDYN